MEIRMVEIMNSLSRKSEIGTLTNLLFAIIQCILGLRFIPLFIFAHFKNFFSKLGLGISVKSESRNKLEKQFAFLIKMELNDVCRLFHRYNFDNDIEFQSGLENIFKTSSLETPERFMQAKIFYFSK